MTAPTAFQVVAAISGVAERGRSPCRSMSAPGRTGTIVINYTNTSNNDMIAPLWTISSTEPKRLFQHARTTRTTTCSRPRSWPWPRAARRASCGPARAASSR